MTRLRLASLLALAGSGWWGGLIACAPVAPAVQPHAGASQAEAAAMDAARQQQEAIEETRRQCEREAQLTPAQVDALVRERQEAFLLSLGPLVKKQGVKEALTEVGLRVAGAVAPLDFEVVDSDVPRSVSASNGMVWVTTGLIKRCANEAQLAAVLAHEVAHVTQRFEQLPHLRALRVACRRPLAPALLPDGGAAPIDLNRAVRQGAEAVVAFGHPKEEADADEAALLALAGAGYDPAAYEVLLEALGDKGHDGSRFQGRARRRIELLSATRAEKKLSGGKTPALSKSLRF